MVYKIDIKQLKNILDFKSKKTNDKQNKKIRLLYNTICNDVSYFVTLVFLYLKLGIFHSEKEFLGKCRFGEVAIVVVILGKWETWPSNSFFPFFLF